MLNANILIVEDDKVCAQLFENILSEHGFTVFVTHNGKNVPDLITENNIKILLLDIVLPEASGYDVLRELQDSAQFRDIPVVVVTGLTSPVEVKKALDNGALDFIRKPCEPIELIARVNSALRVALKQQMLHEQAQMDHLTQLYNRRYFNLNIAGFISESHPNGLSFIMLDCDNFKSVNDEYGHSVGDEVLVSVANVLRKSTKATDIACRYGGEELCLLLPDTTIVQAYAVAERVRENISKIEFSAGDARFGITVSCGVCNTNLLDNKTVRNLIDAADTALYTAKKNGRNRTEFYQKEN